MGIRNGSIVPMGVTLRRVLGRGHWMNREQFEREKKYQAAMAVTRSMLARGVIDEEDFLRIEERLKERFKPVLGGNLL